MTFLGDDMHPLTATQLVALKPHIPFFQGKKGVILPHSNIISRMEPGASLTNNNVPRYHPLQSKQEKEKYSEEQQCGQMYDSVEQLKQPLPQTSSHQDTLDLNLAHSL